MRHSTWFAGRSLFGALVGLALLSACTSTELALGRNDAANPRAPTAPAPALARLTEVQPATSPTPDEHAAHTRDMPAGMKMDGDDMGPMHPHAGPHAGHIDGGAK